MNLLIHQKFTEQEFLWMLVVIIHLTVGHGRFTPPWEVRTLLYVDVVTVTFSLPGAKGSHLHALGSILICNVALSPSLSFLLVCGFSPKCLCHCVWSGLPEKQTFQPERSTGSGVGWGVYGKQAMQSNSLSLKSLRTPLSDLTGVNKCLLSEWMNEWMEC